MLLIYGMPFINRYAGKPFEDNERRVFIFQVASKDMSRFGNIIDVAKEDDLWKSVWGSRMFTVKMIPNYQNEEGTKVIEQR